MAWWTSKTAIYVTVGVVLVAGTVLAIVLLSGSSDDDPCAGKTYTNYFDTSAKLRNEGCHRKLVSTSGEWELVLRDHWFVLLNTTTNTVFYPFGQVSELSINPFHDKCSLFIDHNYGMGIHTSNGQIVWSSILFPSSVKSQLYVESHRKVTLENSGKIMVWIPSSIAGQENQLVAVLEYDPDRANVQEITGTGTVSTLGWSLA